METAQSFLEHRKKQEQAHVKRIGKSKDPMDAVLTMELNITEMCNRKCPFCPRGNPEIYPNRRLHMSVETAETIAADLASWDYKGKISFSGYGENFMNKKFPQIVKAFRDQLPTAIIECNTNGDLCNTKVLQAIYEAGMTCLYVNMYDGPEQKEKFLKVFSEAKIPENKYMFRKHWGDPKEHGLIINNRSGMVKVDNAEDTIKSLAGTPCYYPSYKVMVDWNGDVLFCSNDWGRTNIVGNLTENKLRDIWLGPKMKEIRDRLSKGDRGKSPCDTCTVKGTLFGKASFDLLNKVERG